MPFNRTIRSMSSTRYRIQTVNGPRTHITRGLSETDETAPTGPHPDLVKFFDTEGHFRNEPIVAGQTTWNPEPILVTPENAPRLYEMYAAICKASGLSPTNDLCLKYFHWPTGALASYASSCLEDHAVILHYDGMYAFSQAGCAGAIAHELGHHKYVDAVDWRYVNNFPLDFIRQYLARDRLEIVRQLLGNDNVDSKLMADITWFMSKPFNLSIHQIEPEEESKKEAYWHTIKRINDATKHLLHYPAYCIAKALEEINADNHAQSLLGSAWMELLWQEVRAQKKGKHNTPPPPSGSTAEGYQRVCETLEGRRNYWLLKFSNLNPESTPPWWLHNEHLPLGGMREGFTERLGRFSRDGSAGFARD